MVDLKALIERVREATGPDRKIDAMIAAAVARQPVRYVEDDDATYMVDGNNEYVAIERVTSSIDAALGLANCLLNSTPDAPEHPLELTISSVGHSKLGTWHCRLWAERRDDGNGDPHYGATPALAILAALLSALTSLSEDTTHAK